MLGAKILQKTYRGWGVGEVVMKDPEGNIFVVESGRHELRRFETESVETWESDDPFWSGAVREFPDLASGTAVAGNA